MRCPAGLHALLAVHALTPDNPHASLHWPPLPSQVAVLQAQLAAAERAGTELREPAARLGAAHAKDDADSLKVRRRPLDGQGACLLQPLCCL